MIELSENITSYLSSVFGDEYLQKYREYVSSEYPQYLRFSGSVADHKKLSSDLEKYGIKLVPVISIPGAFKIISGGYKIGKTIEYTLGKYYIQSLSSMLPAKVLNPSSKERTLDLCAAPGSKTGQLAELMNNKGTLIANEVNPSRIRALVYNIAKMNFVNLGVIQNKGELLSKIFANYFDKILVDAPCSALGIVQKKGEVSNWWSSKQVEKIVQLQLRLLVSAIKMLKVGGEIVYSTCTLTVEENELVIDKLLNKYPVELLDIDLPVSSQTALTKINDKSLNVELTKAKRIRPWEINSEGFFIARIRKIAEIEANTKIESKAAKLSLLTANNKIIKKYLESVSDEFEIPFDKFFEFNFLIKGNDVYFINNEWDCDFPNLFLRLGMKFGNIDNKDILHLHSLSARILGGNAKKNIVELLDEEKVKKYLSGSTIKGSYQPFGQRIIKYKNDFLGTAIVTREGLKSQFPRALRTHEIVFPSK